MDHGPSVPNEKLSQWLPDDDAIAKVQEWLGQ
jgi:hypothetical protein